MSRAWLPEPSRTIPDDGGHVTVRVEGWAEDRGRLLHTDGLGRLRVQVAAGEGRLDVLDLDGQRVGYVGAQWLRALRGDLAACAREDVTPVVRAAVVGPRGERNLFLKLAWPARLTGGTVAGRDPAGRQVPVRVGA